MIRKKQKNLRLSDCDLEILDELAKELRDKGIQISDSDVVSVGLRELKRKGGLLKVLQKKEIA